MHIIQTSAVLRGVEVSLPAEPTEEEMAQLLAGNFNLSYATFGVFVVPANIIVQQPGEICSYSVNIGGPAWLRSYLHTPDGGDGSVRDVVYYGTPPVENTQYTITTHITSNLGRDLTIVSTLTIPPAGYKKPVYNNPSLITVPAYPSTPDGSLLGCFTGTSPNGYSLVYSIAGASPGLSGLTRSEYKACFSIDSVTGCLTVLDAEAVFSIPGDNSGLTLLATDTGPYKLSDTAIISLRVV